MNKFLLIPSFQEICFIVIIIVVLFGSKNIPHIVKVFAKSIRSVRNISNDVKKEITDSINDIDD